MKKKFWAVATVILVAVICLSALIGCDGSSRNDKYLSANDFLFDGGVLITMSKRLPKTAKWHSGMEAIKYKKSLEELYRLMQMEEGYVKTLCDGYVLIETNKDGRLYTWGIFSSSVWGDDYDGEYNYVLTNMGVNDGSFLFPIYTMDKPLLNWEENNKYACNISIDELAEFYLQHGVVAVIDGNVLTATAQVGNGTKREIEWYVTYHSERELSVAVRPWYDRV